MSFSPSIHLIYGNQQLRIDETVDALVKKLLQSADPESAHQRFDVLELLKEDGQISEKMDQFQLSCDTFPFLSDRKIIRLDHLEKVKAPKGKKPMVRPGSPTTEEALNANLPASQRLYYLLLKYLATPPEYCAFILTAVASREQDLSAPLLKTIKTNGKIQKFVAYDDDKPVAWLIERGRQKQLQISAGVAQLLLDLVGNELGTLDQELEKLSLLYPPLHALKEEELLEHVRGSKYFSIFRITQSLSHKDLVASLETLNQILLESSSKHVGLFVLISQQFIKLLKIHYLQQQNMGRDAILSQLKIHPFLGKRLIAQAQLFTLEELESIVCALADLDLTLKYNAKKAQSLFQNLFQKICTNQFRSS